MTVTASLLSLLLAAAASLPAQTPVLQPVANEDSRAIKKTGAKAPGKKPDPAKVVEPGKIEGIEVVRGDRGFLGVQLVNGNFRILFYDADRQPKAPDVARAALHWDPKYKAGKEHVVLNLDGDGRSLSSPRLIRPPFVFKLIITLIPATEGTAAAAGETYVIDFRA